MKYPRFLQKGASTIGICAPSQGVAHKIASFDFSLETLKNYGFKIIETKSVRNPGEVSAPAFVRANEFEQLIQDPSVDFIMCATGGDFLIEMLEYVNFDLLNDKIKFVMGASDPTSLLYIITTKLDISTIYGFNAGSFDQTNLHQCLKNNLEIIQGNLIEQTSFDLYESDRNKRIEHFALDKKVCWLSNKDKIKVSGRLIGGCLDVLRELIGTKFDYTKDFVTRYQEDGIIWYFDIFALSSEDVYRALIQMKYSGWFDHVKAIIVGRIMFRSTNTSIDYEQAFLRNFKNIPLIFESDIGHVMPAFTLINGSYATINYQPGYKSIIQELK